MDAIRKEFVTRYRLIAGRLESKSIFEKEAYVKSRSVFLITLIFLVTLAIFVIPPVLHALSVVPPTLSMQPDFGVISEQTTVPYSKTSADIMVLAVTEKENGVGLQARPVDPATLAALPDYAAIDFGHHYTYAISPNRKILALITWPGDSRVGGILHLINLNTWTDTPADLRFDSYVNELTFGEDNRTLYWTIPTEYDLAHGMPRHYQLYRYDLVNRELSAVAQLPSAFLLWSQRLSSENVAIFGIPTSADGLTEDVPRVLIVDSARGHIISNIRLDAVKAGQFHEQTINATPRRVRRHGNM